jgi:Ca2+/Na+ antiporter
MSYEIDDHKMLMPKWMEFIFLVCAFLLSCVWIYLVAGELVALLEILGILPIPLNDPYVGLIIGCDKQFCNAGMNGLLGLVLGLSKGLLGQTVLAWGNSIGDLVSNTVLARSGNPRMAAAGIFFDSLANHHRND